MNDFLLKAVGMSLSVRGDIVISLGALFSSPCRVSWVSLSIYAAVSED